MLILSIKDIIEKLKELPVINKFLITNKLVIIKLKEYYYSLWLVNIYNI